MGWLDYHLHEFRLLDATEQVAEGRDDPFVPLEAGVSLRQAPSP